MLACLLMQCMNNCRVDPADVRNRTASKRPPTYQSSKVSFNKLSMRMRPDTS